MYLYLYSKPLACHHVTPTLVNIYVAGFDSEVSFVNNNLTITHKSTIYS